jgi:ABC-type glycerol-3-phosphate transport system permease component
MIVPLEPVVISLYYNFQSLDLNDTYRGLIVAEAMLYFPFGVFWMRAFFRSVPRSLLDAARIDGASDLKILRSVLLRPAQPAILTLGVLVFVWSWNEFLLPLVIFSGGLVTTAPVNVAIFTGQRVVDIPSQAAAALILSIVPLALYIVFQRQFIRGVLAGSVKG